MGTDLSASFTNKMEQEGITIRAFMPVIFSNLTRKANYRDPRKICIVDGHIGYLGGINVSDDYVNGVGASNHEYWRDTHCA